MCSPSNKRSSATRQQPNNPRHLYASVDPCKERGTIESCQDDLATANSNCSGGRREVNLLIVPFVPTPESQTFRKCLKRMAGTTRLELATSAVTGQRSNQLNYVPAVVLSLADGGQCRARTCDLLLVRQAL